MENILSLIAIGIALSSLVISILSYKQNNIQHKEKLYFDQNNMLTTKIDNYRSLYNDIFQNAKQLITGIPNISSDLGLLLHKYSKDKSNCINHNFNNLQEEILNSLGSQIRFQSIESMLFKLSSLKQIDHMGNNIFNNNVKKEIIILHENVGKDNYRLLKSEYIELINKVCKYVEDNIEYINSSFNEITKKLEKAEIEDIIFDKDLSMKYKQILRLLEYLKRLQHKVNKIHYSNIRITIEEIIYYGSIMTIINKLKSNILDLK